MLFGEKHDTEGLVSEDEFLFAVAHILVYLFPELDRQAKEDAFQIMLLGPFCIRGVFRCRSVCSSRANLGDL
jgi:hypothetical protein